jgi:hypothetical protein
VSLSKAERGLSVRRLRRRKCSRNSSTTTRVTNKAISSIPPLLLRIRSRSLCLSRLDVQLNRVEAFGKDLF